MPEIAAHFFWYCTVAGVALFLLQLCLNLIGISIEDFDTGFNWLSKQALSGFLLMFGLVGLTCTKQFGLSYFVSIVLGGLAGILVIFVTGWIFRMAKGLHSSGTVFNIEDAVGKEATVYQRIPKDGMGKVTLSLHNLTHEIDAVADMDLPSFVSVTIFEKINETTVKVVSR